MCPSVWFLSFTMSGRCIQFAQSYSIPSITTFSLVLCKVLRSQKTSAYCSWIPKEIIQRTGYERHEFIRTYTHTSGADTSEVESLSHFRPTDRPLQGGPPASAIISHHLDFPNTRFYRVKKQRKIGHAEGGGWAWRDQNTSFYKRYILLIFLEEGGGIES